MGEQTDADDHKSSTRLKPLARAIFPSVPQAEPLFAVKGSASFSV